jgi:hypothetical protein
LFGLLSLAKEAYLHVFFFFFFVGRVWQWSISLITFHSECQNQKRNVTKAAEDEAKSSATVCTSPAAANTTTSDTLPVYHAEEGNSNTPAQVQAIDEHSGTAMFAQFTNLNGR